MVVGCVLSQALWISLWGMCSHRVGLDLGFIACGVFEVKKIAGLMDSSSCPLGPKASYLTLASWACVWLVYSSVGDLSTSLEWVL